MRSLAKSYRKAAEVLNPTHFYPGIQTECFVLGSRKDIRKQVIDRGSKAHQAIAPDHALERNWSNTDVNENGQGLFSSLFLALRSLLWFKYPNFAP
jgi:hypothetical protein